MILTEVTGDMFFSEAHCLVCPVNTVGTMGKGLAKAFALKAPGLLKAYREACRRGKLNVETPWIYKPSSDRWFVCIATKKHWRNPSEMEWLESSLMYLRDHWEDLGIKSLCIPPIGCGEGGLDWREVKSLIYKYLDSSQLAVEIWTPKDFGSFY